MSTTKTSDLALAKGVWQIDRESSELGFAVRSLWGLQTVRGVFRAFDGELRVRERRAEGELRIEAASLDTGIAKRDGHLRSPAFFDVDRHPQIVFVVTAASDRHGQLAIDGELTIGAARVRLQVPAALDTSAELIRLRAETTASREDAGLAWNKLGMIRGEARLHGDLTLRRSADAEDGQ